MYPGKLQKTLIRIKKFSIFRTQFLKKLHFICFNGPWDHAPPHITLSEGHESDVIYIFLRIYILKGCLHLRTNVCEIHKNTKW